MSKLPSIKGKIVNSNLFLKKIYSFSFYRILVQYKIIEINNIKM